MRMSYSPRYAPDLGAHVFPMAKYGPLHDLIVEHGLAAPEELVEPAPCRWDDLALVHDRAYLSKVREERLSVAELGRLQLPTSPAVVDGFRVMVQGTIDAARTALSDGLALQLGGGLHHAHPDFGEGFCLFNDVAVAIRVLQRDAHIARAAVVDCDVHQGNGTAVVFRDDPTVLTLSMYHGHNFPSDKAPSTIDVALADGVGDEEYLERLAGVLPTVVDYRPEIAFYLAGADPYYDDRLGGLALSLAGLRRRDALAIGTLREADIPLVVCLAGGYARRLEDSVAINFATVEETYAAFRRVVPR
jgi:acetoin utilization deacetylase AcuC-like enzyme